MVDIRDDARARSPVNPKECRRAAPALKPVVSGQQAIFVMAFAAEGASRDPIR